MASKQAGWKIYKRQMGLLDHGDALWEPAPIYSYKRVKLGDVGYIRRGRFHLLFSAGCALGSRQLGVDVPPTFEPLDVGPIIYSQPRLPGCLCTSTVKETGGELGASVSATPFLEPGVSFSFELSEKQGAALVTKYRTYQEDMELESAFEEYIKRHYDSWVTFARNARHGNDIKPVLVTGVDMTRDFAMIAYSNNGAQLSSEFTTSVPLVASASASVWGKWQTQGLVHTNCGPQQCSTPPSPDAPGSGSADIIQIGTTPNEYNQCVFVRYYTIRKRALMFPKLIKAAAGPHDLGSGDNHHGIPPELMVQSGSDSDIESDSSGDSTTDYSNSVVSHELDYKVVHNVSSEKEDAFDVLAGYIFENSTAEAVLIHHRDISRIREGMLRTDVSDIFSGRQLAIAVGSDRVGKVVHQSQQQSAVTFTRTTSPSLDPEPSTGNIASDRGLRLDTEPGHIPTTQHTIFPTLVAMAPSHPELKAQNSHPKKGFSNDVPPGLQYLLQLDPKSKEFLDLFRSSLVSKDERTTLLALSEEDAQFFVEIIDRAFRAAELDSELKKIAFMVLRELCYRIGHLPGSYVLSDKLDLSGTPRASDPFSDFRKGSFNGKDVAVKTLRISESDDKIRIRKRFCKEVAAWKNLSHPNVLNLIGVPDTIEDGRFSVVCEWMTNGNIVEYVRANTGNHLKLIADAVEGLRYLHHASIVHGDLKGSNVLITNTNPVSACLVDFGFMTIVHDPSLDMKSSKSEVDRGTAHFMAPERFVPSKFGLEKDTPTLEADIYAMGVVIYQVLTGAPPFEEQAGPGVVSKVLGAVKPPKPTNAPELGLSDGVWKLLEDCWQTERQLRPPVDNVLGRVKSAASACGTLSSVGGATQGNEDPEFSKCDMERPPSQESGISRAESLFSKLSEASEAETFITEPDLMSTDALVLSGPSKGESTEEFPAFLFDLAPDYSPHLQTLADPISRSSTPGSETPTRPRLIRGRNRMSAESSGSGQTLLADVAAHRRDQLRSDTDVISTTSTAMSYNNELQIEKPPVADPVASYHFVPGATAMNMGRAMDNSTRQPSRPTSMLLPSFMSMSRPIEPSASPQLDDNAKHNNRHGRSFRQQLSKVFGRTASTHK